MGLRSAYQTYGPAGEPLYTACVTSLDTDRVMLATVDYIFHSGDALTATHVLGFPDLDAITADNYNPQVHSAHSFFCTVKHLWLPRHIRTRPYFFELGAVVV